MILVKWISCGMENCGSSVDYNYFTEYLNEKLRSLSGVYEEC